MNINNIEHFKLLTPIKNGGFYSKIKQPRINSKHILHDRLVFSYLGYRSVIGKGASIREVSRNTSLHANTVKQSLHNLGDLVNHKGKWFAVEPGGFITIREADHWFNRFAYVMLYLPAGKTFQTNGKNKKFGINHAVVYSHLASLAGDKSFIKGFTVRGLCTMLDGMSEKTVKTILGDLQKLGFIFRTYYQIEILPIGDEQLEFFKPKTTVSTSQKGSIQKPDDHNYVFKNDGFDFHRKQCIGLMTQTDAEEAIKKARYLDYDDTRFMNELFRWKSQNDKNMIEGKVGKANFGKYFNKILENRVIKLKENERELREFAAAQELRNSEEERARVLSNVLHIHHTVDEISITNRVNISWKEANKYIGKVGHYFHSVFTKSSMTQQQIVDETMRKKQIVLKNALSKFNKFYDTNESATEKEFKIAINDAIKEIGEGDCRSLFADVEEPNQDCVNV